MLLSSLNIGKEEIYDLLQYDASRYMYIIVEAPDIVIRGEQIGVRVTVFNYWFNDDYLEVSFHDFLFKIVLI